MAAVPRKRSLNIWLLALAGALAALLLLAPAAVASGAGRVLGGLWVTTMSAVMSLFASLFGG